MEKVRTKNQESSLPSLRPYLNRRYVQMFLYFLLMMYSYCVRSVLSVAIVAMNDNSTTTNTNIPIYHWKDQSIVLSSFFWGYIICQIPAAYFGKLYGIKWILVGTTILDSISCILIPTFAEIFGSKGVMLCRFWQGLAQGFLVPSIHTLLGHWAPPCERSRIGTFAYAGSIFGNIICMPITGLICSSWLGWPFSFYIWGTFGLSWTFIWVFLGFDRPRTHNNISQKEKEYIESSLDQCDETHHKIPWFDIFKSLPVWALLMANLGVNWGSSILLTQTPTYLNKIHKFDIKSNAILSAAPYLAMWVLSFFFSSICDYLTNKSCISRGTSRKIFHSIGTLGPALGLIIIGFITNYQSYHSVALLIFVGGTIGAGFCGFQVNHIDLSPNHSGILMAITNGCTSIFSVLSSLTVQFVITDQENQNQWKIIFLLTAAVYILTDIFFIIFASGEVQPWNNISEDTQIE
ncbi:hypothetical protein ABEB36_008201 [Hypothenemus hampei]|uniref:Putative inorganic phosphate cotransporter n=1 Tax=Hypothenemus hampei TaxID=57062 RepID=A0ABD1EL30_HYPHA